MPRSRAARAGTRSRKCSRSPALVPRAAKGWTRADAPGRVSSGAMCEHYVARAWEAFRLDDLWPFTERLERFGIAGFGWGAAWVTEDGTIGSHRDVAAFRDDPERDRIGTTET